MTNDPGCARARARQAPDDFANIENATKLLHCLQNDLDVGIAQRNDIAVNELLNDIKDIVAIIDEMIRAEETK